MKAAWYERNGNARDVLTYGEMETAEPGPGEVRVKIATSGVNPSDVKGRRGRPLVGPRVIPHSDGAGIIDAVGKGVDRARLNERVWLWNAQWKRSFGTAAEFCVLPAEQAVTLPERISFAAGACLGIPAMTAVQAVRLHGNVAGKTLLVTGAGSSVGHYATQIARLHGARVIGTASERRADHARTAGAEFIVDYGKKDVAKVIKELTRDKGVDGIIDMDLSTGARLIGDGIMRPHGTYVCYGSNAPGEVAVSFQAMLWNSYSLKVFVVYDLKPDDRRAVIGELSDMLDSGALKHAVGPRFGLRDIAAAHEAVESGRLQGNVVVDVS